MPARRPSSRRRCGGFTGVKVGRNFGTLPLMVPISEYQLAGTQDENLFAVYNTVECSDVNWPRSWAKWNADTRRVYATAPFLAWDNAWFNAACAFWPVRGPVRNVSV